MRKLVLLAGLLFVAGTSLRAWQEDVHRLLTFWLATQAGFSRDAADDIAGGNQSLDESDYDAAISTMVWVLVRGDEGAAQAVRDNHFPSDSPIPGPPADVPHEAIVLVWRQTGGRWAITAMFPGVG